jgi:hypothetical protein
MNMHFYKILFPVFFSLLIVSVNSSQAQNAYFFVKGKVTDANTKAPLAGASVFAENTTIGAVTNEEGDFKIWLPEGGYSLVVTFTGYETDITRVSRAIAQEGNVNFELNEKVKALEEVNIVITNEVSNGWEKYGTFFRDNFIGRSIFGQQCEIKNPEVLRFFFNKKRNTLKVLSDEPLEVENPALGYVIKFAIDSFVNYYNTNARLFTGQPLFEEMEGTEIQEATWKANRAKAYNGSMLHFMRSLYERALGENGFEVQFIVKNDGKDIPIRLENLYGALNYRKDDALQTVHFRPNQQEVALIYSREKPENNYLQSDPSIKAKTFQLSTLTFARDSSLIIEKNGFYFDQQNITTNGYLAFKKVGDMLPYNYGIQEVAMPVEESIDKASDTNRITISPLQKNEDGLMVPANENGKETDLKKDILKTDQKETLTMDDIRKIFWEMEKKSYTQKELSELKNFLLKFLSEKGL